jgi:hypothetical protein
MAATSENPGPDGVMSDYGPVARDDVPSAEPAARSTSARTLGAELERNRLEHRMRRVTMVVAALRHRAGEHQRDLGVPPRPLRQAIADFEAQTAAINARLRELSGNGRATQEPRRIGSHENGQ